MKRSRMRRIISATVFLGAALLLVGCARFGNVTHVVPSSIGRKITLNSLLDKAGQLHMYYSGWRGYPTAILFVPKESPFELQFVDWSPIDSRGDLIDLVRYIEYRENPYVVRLKAIVTPDDAPLEGKEPMAFIYSKHAASIRQTDSGQAYTIRSPSYSGKNGFGKNRFKLRRGNRR